MTLIFILATSYLADKVHYNIGDYDILDFWSMPIVALLIANMVHYFFTSERLIAEAAWISFGTIGRISARMVHDVKNSLASPMLFSEEIEVYSRKVDPELALAMKGIQENLIAVKHYIKSLNDLNLTNPQHKKRFLVSDALSEAKIILATRLQNVEIQVDGDFYFLGIKAFLVSIFVNLLANSTMSLSKILSRIKKFLFILT